MTKLLRLADFDSLSRVLNPACVRPLRLSHEERFGVQNTVYVDLKIFAKRGRKLVQTTDQRVTVAGVRLG